MVNDIMIEIVMQQLQPLTVFISARAWSTVLLEGPYFFNSALFQILEFLGRGYIYIYGNYLHMISMIHSHQCDGLHRV